MTDEPTKADLVERIEELEQRVQEPGSMDPREWLQSLPTTTRRNVIRAALGMAGVAALSGTASAATNTTVGDGDPTCEWLGDQSAEGYSLANLDELGVNEALVRQCLGAPVYASDSDAPNGTVFFNSNGSELKYKDENGAVFSNAGGGGGALSDSGTDTDGGDDYQLPNSADNIDLQSDGAIQDADSVETGERTIEKLGTYAYDGSNTSVAGDDNYDQVNLNQTRFDDRGYLNDSNDSLDISFDGRYVVRGVVQWKQLPDGTTVETEVRLNGSRIAVSQASTGTSVFPTVTAQTEINLTNGDSVALHTKQDSSGSVQYVGDAFGTYLSVRQVG